MNPKVSIIIATFNSQKTLRNALDSVLHQSFQDWECIVVDGASKDGTIDIVKEYVQRDTRFRYISEPDKGIYEAFNKGWKMAKGEWVMYLGSDDEYTTDGIYSLMLNCEGADIVYGDTFLKYGNGIPLKRQYSTIAKMGGFCCHQSLMMKRVVIEKEGGFDEQYPIMADKDLICKAIRDKCKIIQVHVPVSIFSLEGISSTHAGRFYESFRIDRKYLPLSKCIIKLLTIVIKIYIRKMIFLIKPH